MLGGHLLTNWSRRYVNVVMSFRLVLAGHGRYTDVNSSFVFEQLRRRVKRSVFGNSIGNVGTEGLHGTKTLRTRLSTAIRFRWTNRSATRSSVKIYNNLTRSRCRWSFGRYSVTTTADFIERCKYFR